MQTPSKTSAAMPIDSAQRRVRVVLPMSTGLAPIRRRGRSADQVTGMRADDGAADDAGAWPVEQRSFIEALVATVGDRAARYGPGTQGLP